MSTNSILSINVLAPLLNENVWKESGQFMDAETRFQEFCAMKKPVNQSNKNMKSPYSLVDEIALARQRIQNTLKDLDEKNYDATPWMKSIADLKKENCNLAQKLETLTNRFSEVFDRLCVLEKAHQICHNHPQGKPAGIGNGLDEDSDMELFGSDEETEADKKIREERVKAYEDKKSKKKQVVAKSSIVLDIKPWYDTTDMEAMEAEVRKIQATGLKWGAGNLIPLAYGIRKLQIVAIVEDEHVSVDWLQETIQEEIEALVQSVDIVAFNKL